MVTLEARLVKMELTVADKLEAYDKHIEKLESAGDELQEEMHSALNSAVDMLQQGIEGGERGSAKPRGGTLEGVG